MEKSVKGLSEERVALIDKMDQINEAAKKENRDLNEKEEKELDDLEAQIKGLNKQIERAKFLAEQKRSIAADAPPVHSTQDGPSEKEKKEIRNFSFIKAIREQVSQRGLTGLEKEMHDEAVIEARKSGIEISGIGIPTMVVGEKRALDVATEGADLVQTDKVGMIEALRAKLMVQQLGARMLTGLVGNIDLRRHSGVVSATWEGENDANAESTPTFDKISLTPKRLGAYTEISKQVLGQVSPDMEKFVQDDLSLAIRIALDSAAINGPGTGGAPTGILNTSGIGSVAGGTNGATPTHAHTVDLETAIAVDNADFGKLAYLTTPGVRGYMKKTLRDAGSGLYLWGANSKELNGYRADVSTQVPSTLTKGTAASICHAIIFGNFDDLIIAQWAGIDLVVDPYSLSKTAKIQLVINSWWDIAVRHPESFAAMKDALTA